MKIKIQFLLPALAGFSLLLASCGIRSDGDLITETRSVTDFNALEISVNGTVDVRTDSVFSVEVTAEEGALPYLETYVDNSGTLKIFFSHNLYDVDGLHIRVSAPSWKGFEVNGSADVRVPDAISGNQLRLDISGSGNIQLFNLDYQSIKSQISGSGNLTMSGTADDLDCQVSGSGDVRAFDCPVQTADVDVSGSGKVQVKVMQSLDATISGSGDIEYKGDPQVNSHISGSGNLRKL